MTHDLEKALEWGLKRCWLDHWKVDFRHTDKAPPWVLVNEDTDGGARSKSDASRREARIWLSDAACAAGCNRPLMVLFHEIVHISLEAAGIKDDNDLVELHIDRMAEVMEYAYLKKME